MESGSITTACDHFKMTVPEDHLPLCFIFCSLDKVPFSAFVGLGLFVYNVNEPGKTQRATSVEVNPPFKCLDYHTHFDPLQKYGERDFKRLNSLEFTTVKRKIEV